MDKRKAADGPLAGTEIEFGSHAFAAIEIPDGRAAVYRMRGDDDCVFVKFVDIPPDDYIWLGPLTPPEPSA